MDNKAYLDEIAVKSKKKFSAGPILTPLMIKLIAAAAVAVIAMIVIGSVLNAKNTEVAEVHQMVYARITSLLDKKGPIVSYQKNLKSSDLRSYTVQLLTSLDNTQSAIGSSYKDAKNATDKVKSENTGLMTVLKSDLNDAKLSGTLDSTYSYNMAYHLSLLILLEQQALGKADNDSYANALNASIHDLQALQEEFQDYSDSH